MISGVPQGSILGPLLFILYINDLPCYLSAITPFMFADDTKIVLKLNGLEDEKLLQDDIQALNNWSYEWSLQFSPSKCGLLRFCNDSNILYRMSNVEFVQNSLIKDLGISISNDLSWSPHYYKTNYCQSL